MLNQDERRRYDRQMILPELGLSGQQRLKQAKVLVVGAGGLGCPVLQYLTAAGVGHIGIVDDDVVEVSNLHRQILYSLQDVGNNKALIAKGKLQELNPYVLINAYTDRLTAQNAAEVMKDYDLVIDGSDNFSTRYLVNEMCLALDKPLIFGSIFKFEGQVSVFNYQDGPNYRDLFPEQPGAGEVPNCADIGVIGVLPGMIGTAMANEAVKVICGIGEVLSGKLLIVDALTGRTNTFSFAARRPAVPVIEVGTAADDVVVSETSLISEIDRAALKEWLDILPGVTVLVDVREPDEFGEFNIGGVNIPLDELSERFAEIRPAKHVVFCCKSGIRSRQAANLYFDLTQQACFHLRGGIIKF